MNSNSRRISPTWWAVCAAASVCMLVAIPVAAKRGQEGKGGGARLSVGGERRLALVIGNANYGRRPLKNPLNDARAVAEVLRESGFEVETGFDLSKAQLEEKILRFGDRLKAGKGVGLFYYSGHGMQVGGENFLLPVEFEIDLVPDRRLAGNYATSVDLILGHMDVAGNNFNLIILDACRDNPFEKSWKSARSEGLAAVEAPSGTFIAYATAPNRVASDGEAALSPYTAALVNQIRVRGQTVYEVFSNVGREVEDKTGRRQRPWIASSLRNNFCFQGCAPAGVYDAHAGVSAPEGVAPASPKRGKKSMRILYSDGVVTSQSKLPSREVFPVLNDFSTPVKAALEKEGLKITTRSQLSDEDRQQYFGAINSRYKDSNALKSFPFALFVSPGLTLEDLGTNEQGKFIALAGGRILIIDTENGKTLHHETIAPTRGYGDTKTQARRNAMRAAGLNVPDAFIRRVAERAR